MQISKTANYKAVADQAGHRFLFYCQVSGAHVCITKEIYPGQLEEALGLAWNEEGCWQFNQCRRCGKWVIDAVFNTEVLESEKKVCHRFGRLSGARLTVCPDCDERLSGETLFDCYKRRHSRCFDCDTVLAPGSKYCPNCGTAIQKSDESQSAYSRATY